MGEGVFVVALDSVRVLGRNPLVLSTPIDPKLYKAKHWVHLEGRGDMVSRLIMSRTEDVKKSWGL